MNRLYSYISLLAHLLDLIKLIQLIGIKEEKIVSLYRFLNVNNDSKNNELFIYFWLYKFFANKNDSKNMVKNKSLVILLFVAAFVQLIVLFIYYNKEKMRDNDELFLKADIAISSKNYNEAISYYDILINKKPTIPLYYHKRGLCYEETKQYELAEKDYNKIIELEPKSERGYFFRGALHLKTEKYKNAIEDFEHASNIKPGEYVYWLNLAFAELKEKQYEKSINHLIKCIELNNSVPESYFYLSLDYKNISETEISKRYLAKAASFETASKEIKDYYEKEAKTK